jgi:hypothetical protein
VTPFALPALSSAAPVVFSTLPWSKRPKRAPEGMPATGSSAGASLTLSP